MPRTLIFLIGIGLLISTLLLGGWVTLMHTDNPIRREMIAKEMREMVTQIRNNPEDQQLVERVRAAIRSDYYFESLSGINTVKRLGPLGAFAVDDLISVLHQEDQTNRRDVMLALSAIGPAAAPAIPELTEALRTDTGKDVAWFAAQALGNIGITDESVMNALDEATHSKDHILAEEATKALRQLRQ